MFIGLVGLPAQVQLKILGQALQQNAAKIAAGGVPSVLGGAAAAVLADLLFPAPAADGTLPDDVTEPNPNNAENVDGGNPQTPVMGDAGNQYVIEGSVTFKTERFNPELTWVSNTMTLGFKKTVTAPFGEAYLSEEQATNSYGAHLKINASGQEILLVGLIGLGGVFGPNTVYKTTILDLTIDYGLEEELPGDFEPTPNPKPTPDNDKENIPEQVPTPQPGDNPDNTPGDVPEKDPDDNDDDNPEEDNTPNPNQNGDDQIIIYYPEPIIIEKEVPVIIEGPSLVKEVPVIIEKEVPLIIETPKPANDPTKCDPCKVCDDGDKLDDLTEAADAINDLLEEMQEQIEENQEGIEDKLKCHEDSFKSIINNQKLDRSVGLVNMAYSIHNGMMLSFDASSTVEYGKIAASSGAATTIHGYCGNDDSINFSGFISSVNSAVNSQQNTANTSSSWRNSSLIITTSANIWRVIITGIESLRQYLKLLGKSITNIGNALKTSKVVQDDSINFMSLPFKGITQEQEAYDLSLLPGNDNSFLPDSVDSVLTPLNSDNDVWIDFKDNFAELETLTSEEEAELLDSWNSLEVDLNANLIFPDNLQPETIG
jgi:hypothetical protein